MVTQLANEVIAGKHGNGHGPREQSIMAQLKQQNIEGITYERVRQRVNEIVNRQQTQQQTAQIAGPEAARVPEAIGEIATQLEQRQEPPIQEVAAELGDLSEQIDAAIAGADPEAIVECQQSLQQLAQTINQLNEPEIAQALVQRSQQLDAAVQAAQANLQRLQQEHQEIVGSMKPHIDDELNFIKTEIIQKTKKQLSGPSYLDRIVQQITELVNKGKEEEAAGTPLPQATGVPFEPDNPEAAAPAEGATPGQPEEAPSGLTAQDPETNHATSNTVRDSLNNVQEYWAHVLRESAQARTSLRYVTSAKKDTKGTNTVDITIKDGRIFTADANGLLLAKNRGNIATDAEGNMQYAAGEGEYADRQTGIAGAEQELTDARAAQQQQIDLQDQASAANQAVVDSVRPEEEEKEEDAEPGELRQDRNSIRHRVNSKYVLRRE
jgi:hypothetical protein